MKELLKSYVGRFKSVGAELSVRTVAENMYDIIVDAGQNGMCGLVVSNESMNFLIDYLNRKLELLKKVVA